jgi:cell fate (sporulation/competence/biofilm development) regulator YlbF (YheA/YmcA/DUF963 family)
MNKQKITRLTLNELSRLVENTAKRVMKESIDQDREIQLAYKEIQQMGKHLSSIGLRLDGTPYYQQYQRMKDEVVKLNNALIAHIQGGGK